MLYIVLFIFSFLLTYFIKEFFIKKSFVAEVNERSSHSVITPHGGGIAIAFSWFVGISYLFYFNKIDNSLYYSLMVGVIISTISYLDDIFELSAKLRLFVQGLVAFLGLYFIGGLGYIDFGLFSVENQVLTNTFAFFLIVWFINLYNFLDGINGYAGSEAIFLSVVGYILFSGEYFLVLAVATLGFLCWNWNKAKIFMGDVGSTLLGYNVAIFTIYHTNQDSINFWIWIILFGVFWFDATLTLIRRKLNNEILSQAHKKHAYQRLTQAGWSHQKVSSFAILLNIILFSLLYFIDNIFIVFCFMLVIFFSSIRFIDSKQSFI